MARKTSTKIPRLVKPLKYLILGIIVVFALFFLFKSTRHFLKNTDLFTVREVVRSPSLSFIDARNLEGLIGRNIFSVDLAAVHNRLQARYPHIDELRVVREFPDRIRLVARTREPLAWATVSQEPVFLDKDGIALPAQGPASGLPEIRGLAQDRRLVFGQPMTSDRLSAALDIIQEIGRNKYLDPYAVKMLDVEHPSKIGVYLETGALPFVQNNFLVIMDRDHIPRKVQSLGILLSQGNLKPQEIKYIDLRFKEPILAQQ